MWCHYYLLWVKILSAATRQFFAIVSYYYLPIQTTTLFIYTATQNEPLEPQNGASVSCHISRVYSFIFRTCGTEEENKALKMSKNHSTPFIHHLLHNAISIAWRLSSRGRGFSSPYGSCIAIETWAVFDGTLSHTIRVWCIYLQLVDFYGKCR